MSIDVAENETGTFRCRGEGIPEPSVEWLVNGVPVTSKFSTPPHTRAQTQTTTTTVTAAAAAAATIISHHITYIY